MKNFYFFRRLVFTILALAGSFLTVSQVEAQSFNRGVFVEEFTGTWCGYCPRGAFYLDSLKHHMPDNAIVVSWHNSDQMTYSPNGEATMAQTWGISGYPNVLVNRWDYLGNIGAGGQFWSIDDELYTGVIKPSAESMPIINFSLENIQYNPTTRTVEFDMHISPRIGAQFIPREDTTEYRYVIVLTEDSLIYSQTNYFSQWANPIPKFRHDDVARQTVGDVRGNKFDMGTISPKAYPIKIHQSIKLSKTTFKANKMRIKAAVADAVPLRHTIHNAAQSNYLTTYPVPENIAITKPAAGEMIPAGTQDYPITFSASAGVTTNKKIEFSSDNGTTWTKLTDLTTDATTYAWDVPATPSDANFIRITDANNVIGMSEAFKIFKPAIVVFKPYEGNVFTAGSPIEIGFTSTAGVTTNKKIEYSLDNGATWTLVTNVTTDINEYIWTAPDVESTQAMIRITDQSTPTPIVGESGVFTIQKGVAPKPGFKTLTMTGVTNGNIPFNAPTVFSWTFENGTVPGPYDIEMSTDGKATWTKIAEAAQGTNQVDWTTPGDEYIPEAYFHITNHTAEVTQTFTTGTSISIGTPASVKNTGGTPTAFRLSTNYPNPFTSMTNINFDVPERSFVTLVVRNELGQTVAQLASGMLDAGTYTADFDASKLPAGLYTYTLESGATKLTGKMSIVR